jgi:hypothetical protein
MEDRFETLSFVIATGYSSFVVVLPVAYRQFQQGQPTLLRP